MTTSLKLDNPAWSSLNEIQSDFSIIYPRVKFYDPAYGPFGGAITKELAIKGINEYAKLIDSFFLISENLLLNCSVRLNKELFCD